MMEGEARLVAVEEEANVGIGSGCNIYDPEDWRKFFEAKFPGSHVTCSTAVVDGDALLQALAERRTIIKCLNDALELMEVEEYERLGFMNVVPVVTMMRRIRHYPTPFNI